MNIIHHNANARSLQFFTNYVVVIWLAIVLTDPFETMSDFPVWLSTQTGPLMVFFPRGWTDIFYTHAFLMILKIGLVISLLAAMIPKTARIGLTASCIGLTLFQSIIRSFGHMGHQESALLQIILALTLFQWSTKDSNPPSLKYTLPLVTSAFLLCFSYTLAGMHRAIAGGLTMFMGENINFWIIQQWYMQGYHSASIENFMTNHIWFQYASKVGFIVVTFFEMLAVFCLFSKRIRIAFLLVMVPFHIICWALMGIFFWQNMLLFILLVDPIGERWKPANASSRNPPLLPES